jgi:hemoglobin
MVQTSIFDASGGKAAIAVAVDQFYRRVLADDLLAPYFVQRSGPAQSTSAGVLHGGAGRCGRLHRGAIGAAHAGRNRTTLAFERVAGHLAETLAALGVPAALVGQILSQIAPYNQTWLLRRAPQRQAEVYETVVAARGVGLAACTGGRGRMLNAIAAASKPVKPAM